MKRTFINSMLDFDDSLILSNANYAEKEQQVLDSLSDKSSLVSISIKNCNLDNNQLKKLLNNVHDPKNLFEIDVSNNILGSSAVSSLFCVDILPSTLILDCVQLEDTGLIALSKCNLENLRILSLSSNNITSRGIIVFFSSFESDLSSLNLSNNKIDDSSSFSIKNNIRTLDISSNSFSPSGISALCENLANGQVKSLNMSNMNLSKNFKSLATLLKSPTLRNVYFRNCSISSLPDIPAHSKLKVLDLTGNKSIVEFKVPDSVAVIGDFKIKKKLKLDFSDFDKMTRIIDELKKNSDIIVDDSTEIMKLQEKIQAKVKELNTSLMILQRKIKPTVKSLSKYASKITSHKEILPLNITGPTVEGFPISSSLSIGLKYHLFEQFLMMMVDMNEKGLYFVSDFDINSFVVSKNNKLQLKDKTITIKEKLCNNSIETFATQLFGFVPHEASFYQNLGTSLLSSSIIKTRSPHVYTIERGADPLIKLCETLNTFELMNNFHLNIKDETAVDHGGVTRDIFSQFWEDISISHFEMSNMSVSLVPIKGKENFEEIGKIMAKSLLDCIPISIPIHSIVFRYIVNQIPQNKKEWVQSLSEYDPQIASNIDYDNPSDEEISERCKEILIDRRLDELNELKKGFFFSNHIEIIVKSMFDWWTLMSSIIGDEELTPKKLLHEIKFLNLPERTIKIWIKTIKNFNKDQIKQFLRLITGLNGMPAGGYKKRGKSLIIVKSDRFFAHTCSFELESPEYRHMNDLTESLSTVFIAMELDYSMNEWYNL